MILDGKVSKALSTLSANLHQRRLRQWLLAAVNPFGRIEMLPVRAIIIEEEVLGEAIRERLFGNLMARIVLAGAELHHVELGGGGVARGCIVGAMALDELLQ